MQRFFECSIGVNMCRHDAWLVGGGQDDSAGAVAEQNASRAVGPVKNSRICLGADNQYFACAAGVNEAVGNIKCIDET